MLWIILTAILGGILAVIGLYLCVVMVYQLFIGIHGFFAMKPLEKKEDKQYRFAVIVCARNERAVIGELLDSLREQEYPRDKFDLFVVADNCTDDTAKVAAEHGAIVYERFNDQLIGKGHALRWALPKIEEDYGDRYEVIAVFDADNLADKHFLQYTNEAFCAGADATQGYRETKNPFDNALSGCYAIYWYMLSRFYHQARANRGMSCSIGGTGFAFKKSIIAENGWDTQTLTEDSEFAARRTLDGCHIQFVREAVFYDEQPTEWKVASKQRKRWMCGVMQESRLLRKAAWKSWRGGNKRALDIVMMQYGFPAVGWLLVTMFLSLAISAIASIQFMTPWPIVLGVASLIVGSFLSMFVMALLAVIVEKKPIGKFMKAILFYPVFMAPMMVYTFECFFKKDMVWEQIRHGSTEQK